MADYRRLTKVLEKEILSQTKLLELLVKERAAITTLRNDELAKIGLEKEKILTKARGLGDERNTLITGIGIKPDESPKLADIAHSCPDPKLRSELVSVGEELKGLVTQVRTMNDHNAALIRSSIGLVLSTISIFRGAADADLPTYESSGKLKNESVDPTVRRSTPLSREG